MPFNITQNKEANFIIPSRYRKMENMHIVFWLAKDISWCLNWKTLGVAMAIPTLTIAVVIAWRTRRIRAELAHNLAVTFWIAANSYWMISEFFGFDEVVVWREFTGKHISLLPFLTGAVILLYYYAVQRPADLKRNNPVTL